MRERLHLPVLSVVGCGLLLSYPCWRYGMSANGDAVFHSMWYTNFARQFFAGELYPRWLVDMNAGLGSPVFFFYAPLPYYATLIFSPLLPDDPYGLSQLGASSALALTASGLAAYLWLRSFNGAWAAALGAIFYISAPYHLRIDLYTRNAFAESWAFVWMPLTLYFVARARHNSRVALCGISVSYAALAMTHLPGVVVFSAVPPAYSLWRAGEGARRGAALTTLGGMLLGVGLAAVYLLPAMTMQGAISVADFTASAYHERWLRFQPFAVGDLDSQLFWASALMIALAVFSFAAGRRNASERDGRELSFWLAVALACVLMMLPPSRPVWQVFKTLQSIQFPWRFGTVLCLAASALVAAGLASARRPRGVLSSICAAAACASLLAFFSFAAYTVRDARPDSAAYVPHEVFLKRVAERRDATEYRPSTAASIQEEAFGQLLARVCKSGARTERACVVGGAGAVRITDWRPREVALDVESAGGVSLNVSQFYYPGWVAAVDERPYALTPSEPDGLLHLNLPAGTHYVRLRLSQGWQEITGKLTSVVALLLLLVCLFVPLRLEKEARD
ncbi:MAG: hypothetical protein LC785_16285 [Acidobacteria bacterium]|nr:hypothetical protein [Acidobacteriota bacterium]MCA1643462.1 hypothetical protein [Acidobacteriota bacterium]